MKKVIVIAAAGKGSRLGAGKPKCLIEVNGHAIFEYQLKAFAWADEIRMVVGFQAADVMEKVTQMNPNVKFIVNDEFNATTTLQSNYLGAADIQGKALFIDGDMIISRETAQRLQTVFEENEEFVGVATDISEEPVYACVEDQQVIWFDYNRIANHEWANVALLETKKLEYLPTHFFVQIEKSLPIKAVEIERLEVDTKEDLIHAERVIQEHPDKYDYWNSINSKCGEC